MAVIDPFMSQVFGGSFDEAERSRRLRDALDAEEARRKQEEQERINRVLNLTGDGYEPPPGLHMNSGSPRTDARLALAERNVANMNRGLDAPAAAEIVAREHDPNFLQRRAQALGYDRNGQPTRSTYVPPQEEETRSGPPSLSNLNNGIGGLTVFPSRSIRRPGEDEMAERRAVAQNARRDELASRAEHRKQYFANQATQRRDMSYLDMLNGLDPRVAQQFVKSVGDRHLATQADAERSTAFDRADAKAEADRKADEQLSLMELYGKLVESGKLVEAEKIAQQIRALGGDPSAAGQASVPSVGAGLTHVPTLEEITSREAAGQGMEGTADMVARAAQIPPAATPEQIVALGFTPGRLKEAIESYESRNLIFNDSPEKAAAHNEGLQTLRDLYRRVTGADAPGIHEVNPQSYASEFFGSGFGDLGILGM